MDTTTTTTGDACNHENLQVRSLGGNQHRVTCRECEEVRDIDLDGLDYVSNEDYDRMEEAGLDMELYLSPQHDVDGDVFWLAAMEEQINYSGIDVEQLIREHA